MIKIIDKICEPVKGSKFSACVDLKSSEDVVIEQGETAIIDLGVSLDLEKMPPYVLNNMDKFYLQLETRSSFRAKGIICGSGIIDIDYPGVIKIILHNFSYDEPFVVKKGERVGQMMLLEHKTGLLGIESEDERVGGFGSTGV